MNEIVIENNRYTVDTLYQWDINQFLEIRGLSLPSIPEIHFTNETMDRAIVRQSTMDKAGVITVDVPNSLLQKPYKIKTYVCIYEGDTFRSLCEIVIPVKARKKPGDYTLEANDNEVYSFNALENTLIQLQAEVTTLKDTAIKSVFGRKGDVKAQKGDYTADMVGASPVVHAHGAITSDGKLGNVADKVLVTGASGVIGAKDIEELGVSESAKKVTGSGAFSFTTADNTEYTLTNITNLTMVVGAVNCHGFITFGTKGSVTVSGFTATGGDDINEALSGETWEFSVWSHNGGGYIAFKNWSA